MFQSIVLLTFFYCLFVTTNKNGSKHLFVLGVDEPTVFPLPSDKFPTSSPSMFDEEPTVDIIVPTFDPTSSPTVADDFEPPPRPIDDPTSDPTSFPDTPPTDGSATIPTQAPFTDASDGDRPTLEPTDNAPEITVEPTDGDDNEITLEPTDGDDNEITLEPTDGTDNTADPTFFPTEEPTTDTAAVEPTDEPSAFDGGNTGVPTSSGDVEVVDASISMDTTSISSDEPIVVTVTFVEDVPCDTTIWVGIESIGSNLQDENVQDELWRYTCTSEDLTFNEQLDEGSYVAYIAQGSAAPYRILDSIEFTVGGGLEVITPTEEPTAITDSSSNAPTVDDTIDETIQPSAAPVVDAIETIPTASPVVDDTIPTAAPTVVDDAVVLDTPSPSTEAPTTVSTTITDKEVKSAPPSAMQSENGNVIAGVNNGITSSATATATTTTTTSSIGFAFALVTSSFVYLLWSFL